MLKITVDTNVLVSSILNPHGPPSKIIQLVRQKKVTLVLSPYILDEVRRVLNYSKISKLLKKKGIQKENLFVFIDKLAKNSIVTPGKLIVNEIERDPSDNMILACAIEGKADFILSGDKHLTDLISFKNIKILNPSEFLKNL